MCDLFQIMITRIYDTRGGLKAFKRVRYVFSCCCIQKLAQQRVQQRTYGRKCNHMRANGLVMIK